MQTTDIDINLGIMGERRVTVNFVTYRSGDVRVVSVIDNIGGVDVDLLPGISDDSDILIKVREVIE